jgi:molybdenum cofactor cytidylyltransferase
MHAADVTAIILAAGASSRMGRCKAALELNGRTALRRILDACAAGGVTRALIVTGAQEDEVRRAALGAALARDFVANPRWESGRSSSLQAGLAALPADAAAFLLWPVDVPLPSPGIVAALLAARRDHPGYEAWIPSHERRRGHPALFARSTIARFLALRDDASARAVVRALEAHHVETDDASVLWDMNTPEDYERLRAVAKP